MDRRESFQVIDAKRIDQFVSDAQEEDLHLEFKVVCAAEMERDDRKNLAKAVSGFANADGGIIVWGVEAKGGRGEESSWACGKREIAPLSLFMSKLNEATGAAVNPIVDGVVHEKIETKGDSGFAKTLVPASDCGPHMAKAGEDRYYKRTGDRFAKMEHYEIADMFGRRRRPNLSLESRMVRGGTSSSSSGTTYNGKVVFGIRNNGRASATAPYLAISVAGGYSISQWGLDGNGNHGLHRLAAPSTDELVRFGGMANIVVHPGTIYDVTAVDVKVRERSEDVADVVVRYELAAGDIPVTSGTLTVKGRDIVASLVRPSST